MKKTDKQFYLSKLPKGWIIKFERYPGRRALDLLFYVYGTEPNYSSLRTAYLKTQTGYTDFDKKVISVRGCRPEAAIRKTILHELAHVLCGKQKLNTNYHHYKFYNIFGKLVDEFDWTK